MFFPLTETFIYSGLGQSFTSSLENSLFGGTMCRSILTHSLRGNGPSVREGWMVGDSMVVRADSWDSPPSHVEER